jgi:hypothetical protein
MYPDEGLLGQWAKLQRPNQVGGVVQPSSTNVQIPIYKPPIRPEVVQPREGELPLPQKFNIDLTNYNPKINPEQESIVQNYLNSGVSEKHNMNLGVSNPGLDNEVSSALGLLSMAYPVASMGYGIAGEQMTEAGVPWYGQLPLMIGAGVYGPRLASGTIGRLATNIKNPRAYAPPIPIWNNAAKREMYQSITGKKLPRTSMISFSEYMGGIGGNGAANSYQNQSLPKILYKALIKDEPTYSYTGFDPDPLVKSDAARLFAYRKGFGGPEGLRPKGQFWQEVEKYGQENLIRNGPKSYSFKPGTYDYFDVERNLFPLMKAQDNLKRYTNSLDDFNQNKVGGINREQNLERMIESEATKIGNFKNSDITPKYHNTMGNYGIRVDQNTANYRDVFDYDLNKGELATQITNLLKGIKSKDKGLLKDVGKNLGLLMLRRGVSSVVNPITYEGKIPLPKF